MQTYVVHVKSAHPETWDEEQAQQAIELTAIRNAVTAAGFPCEVDVEALGEKHCDFMGEVGIAVNVGLQEKVRFFSCCSWQYPHTGPIKYEGDDIGSLITFVMSKTRTAKQLAEGRLEELLYRNTTTEAGE